MKKKRIGLWIFIGIIISLLIYGIISDALTPEVEKRISAIKIEYQELSNAESIDVYTSTIAKLEAIRDTTKFEEIKIVIDSLLLTKEQLYKNVKNRYVRSNYAGVYLAAEKIVKASLKAPSTAIFQEYGDAKFYYDEKGEVYTIDLWVDAQNSFGAMIRTTYRLEFSNETGKWKFLSINEI